MRAIVIPAMVMQSYALPGDDMHTNAREAGVTPPHKKKERI